MNKCSATCSDFRWSNSDGPIFPTEKKSGNDRDRESTHTVSQKTN